MKLIVGGGCGEHGRNCFFVENGEGSFLVDCGLMEGDADPYPRLLPEQIQKARWLFVTHSHLDHTGAYRWLLEKGFCGQAVMTGETAYQLGALVNNPVIIDKAGVYPGEITLADSLSVQFGRSGQCAGSVWFRMEQDGESILFSGDYCEDTFVYACDSLRGLQADIAVLDSAYGDDPLDAFQHRQVLSEFVKHGTVNKRAILFPVPKYGRGLEILLLIHRKCPDASFFLDDHLQNELARLQTLRRWMKLDSFQQLCRLQFKPLSADCGAGFAFLADPQLKAQSNRDFTEHWLRRKGHIILTGNADQGSFSHRLIEEERAQFLRYSVHMNYAERLHVEEKNMFLQIVPFHCGAQITKESF